MTDVRLKAALVELELAVRAQLEEENITLCIARDEAVRETQHVREMLLQTRTERDDARDAYERHKVYLATANRQIAEQEAEKFKALDMMRAASTQRDAGLVREVNLRNELDALKREPSYTLRRLEDHENLFSALREALGHGDMPLVEAARAVVQERDAARRERDGLRTDMELARRHLCAKT